MKKFLTVVTGAILSVSLFAGTVSASSINDELQLDIDSFKEQVLDSLHTEYPNAQFIDESEGQKDLYKSITPFQAASPLTSLEVYAATSTNYPQYEYFTSNQLTSVEDHGGEELYIVTEEIGYGTYQNTSSNAPWNTMNDRMNIR